MSSRELSRRWPETNATDELRLLTEFLTFLRITAVNKLAGLDRAAAAATPFPASPLFSALGVIRHLTSVERYWLSIVGGGQDVPNRWDSPDPDIDFRLSEQDTPDSVVAAYQEQWELSRRALQGRNAGDPSAGDADKTVRWLLTHVVQETARHVGHLDVLREFADGTTGE
ncbi:DinB family protein [Kutzneria kofuensis]|uniref:Putative damage-inducible protein DinB n=1 Tax=Kutzneria kofuensis TaxID=103725 RepID=A0A7W9NEA3_9PSEU|nr:DinB family protein [Kutzneria kofuensis]MBB5888921.1 putative damage-inducible protein DinB [Kutzneria kofuensis]